MSACQYFKNKSKKTQGSKVKKQPMFFRSIKTISLGEKGYTHRVLQKIFIAQYLKMKYAWRLNFYEYKLEVRKYCSDSFNFMLNLS